MFFLFVRLSDSGHLILVWTKKKSHLFKFHVEFIIFFSSFSGACVTNVCVFVSVCLVYLYNAQRASFFFEPIPLYRKLWTKKVPLLVILFPFNIDFWLVAFFSWFFSPPKSIYNLLYESKWLVCFSMVVSNALDWCSPSNYSQVRNFIINSSIQSAFYIILCFLLPLSTDSALALASLFPFLFNKLINSFFLLLLVFCISWFVHFGNGFCPKSFLLFMQWPREIMITAMKHTVWPALDATHWQMESVCSFELDSLFTEFFVYSVKMF